MSYQVIARKYRPQRFEDVVGQDHVTQTLRNALGQKRLAHAYLFSGPRGTGKTTIARIFAKCLNCTGGPKADFDDTDPRVMEITEGRSMDVLEIDGASNRGIDEIRELRETVKYAPAGGRFKVYIIDEVHMLTKEAFNALLKTLEEPPAHVKFMFATTEPEKVLPTILSRCQRFDLRRIPAALIVKHLAFIATQEKVAIDEPACYAIARGAEGCMRDAESTLDQLISFCGNKIEEPDVLSMFGLASQGQVLELAGTVLSGEIPSALRLLDGLVRNGKEVGRLLSDLLHHFRNVLIFQVSRGDTTMLEVSEAEAASLAQQGKLISGEGLTRIMEVLSDCEVRMRDAASKKILLEVALLNAIQARTALSLDTVLQQLQLLREPAGGAPTPLPQASPTPQVTARAPEIPAPIRPGPSSSAPAKQDLLDAGPATAVATVTASPGDLDQLWANLLEAVGRVSQFTRTYLLEAHPVSFAKGVLLIGFDPQFEDHIGLVDNARNHTMLQTKLAELGHPNSQIKFVKADAPAGRVTPVPAATPSPAGPPAPPLATARSASHTVASVREKPVPIAFSKDDFKNDPLIQKALEIFKGRIVDVRA